MKKNFLSISIISTYTALFFVPLASAQTWQSSEKKFPIVVENSACNSSKDTLGIKNDNSLLLTCQSGIWAKTETGKGCPSDMSIFNGNLCVDKVVSTLPGTSLPLLTLAQFCAKQGKRMPHYSEGYAISNYYAPARGYQISTGDVMYYSSREFPLVMAFMNGTEYYLSVLYASNGTIICVI